MEDSYTVHRRRKAAARRREKTPDPPRREDRESGEDDSVARAKMEKMVEDTENMAERGGSLEPQREDASQKISGKKTVTDKTNQPSEEAVRNPQKKLTEFEKNSASESSEIKRADKSVTNSTNDQDQPVDKFRTVLDSGNGVAVVEPRDSDVRASTSASKIPQDAEVRKPEKPVNLSKNLEERAVEKVDEIRADQTPKGLCETSELPRPKKRSKDKFLTEKKSYGTDSSDGDERTTRAVRRTKSPDGTKARNLTEKSQSRSRAAQNDTDEDRNTSNNESRSKSNRDKRHPSKHRYSTGTEDEISQKKVDRDEIHPNLEEDARTRKAETRAKLREKRSVSRHRYPSDTDDDIGIKKSETFPQRSERAEKQIIRRSASEIKKQIIPLSDDSLIEDFAKAQEDYLRRERGILAPDFMDDDYLKKSGEAGVLRKRKVGVLHSDPDKILKNREKNEENEAVKKAGKTKSWFSWVPFFRKKDKIDDPSPDKRVMVLPANEKVSFFEFLKTLQEIVAEFRAYVRQNPRETEILRRMRNRCIGEIILMIIYCGLGAFVFRFTEGAFETFYKCGVKRVKRDFLDNLWNYSHNMREEDWKSMARRKLMEFEEQLHNAHEAGVHSYSGQKNWTFLNSVVYCLTVITTIGYGHISPRTLAGRAITIVYAIFGIPMFLIILADFGKLFTRGIKFLWAFVRRLYYTGSCRKVRRTGPVQEVMKGVQLVYDFATFRRPSQMNPEEVEEMQRHQNMQAAHTQTVLNLDGNIPLPETPGTPAMSNFAIDDEFNLPISVAISILLGYIFVGATAYYMIEEWGFFESFYFVFISMSTIGFGDFVPENPIFMMFSILYLVFGLALTSMCINVVQTVLSDSFKQASQKIGATIGFEVPGEDGVVDVEVEGEEVDVADVQVTVKDEDENREKIAPKAKQEDVDV